MPIFATSRRPVIKPARPSAAFQGQDTPSGVEPPALAEATRQSEKRRSLAPPLELEPKQGDFRRFVFLDGLRGVASMSVVVFHLFGNLAPAVEAWFPTFLAAVALNGDLGVDVFFVLSGFVISHSVSKGERSWRYLGLFGLRRSIRLDPPLWTTIALEIGLIRVSLLMFPDLGTRLPGVSQIVANVTYSQHFLGIADIEPVFWSLTYEVQFYVVTVVALVLLHRLPKGWSWPKTVFGVTFFYSLAVWIGVFRLPLAGLFVDRWFQFALGISAWAVFTRRIRKVDFAMLSVITLLVVLLFSRPDHRAHSAEIAVICATAMAFVSLTGKLENVLSGRFVQFLGKISYSLYLIHLSVGWRFISVFRRLFGPELGPWMGGAAFFGGILLSILAAWIMYVTLEAPSVKLARKVRLPRGV